MVGHIWEAQVSVEISSFIHLADQCGSTEWPSISSRAPLQATRLSSLVPHQPSLHPLSHLRFNTTIRSLPQRREAVLQASIDNACVPLPISRQYDTTGRPWVEGMPLMFLRSLFLGGWGIQSRAPQKSDVSENKNGAPFWWHTSSTHYSTYDTMYTYGRREYERSW